MVAFIDSTTIKLNVIALK